MTDMDLSLENLRSLMTQNGVTNLLVKELAPNDNAKNQLYLSGSLDVANIIPFGAIRTDERNDKILKAPLSFYWLQNDGRALIAPNAQAILYPQYPEVRLSGFLRGAAAAPNKLLNTRSAGRLFFFGITADRRVIGHVSSADSPLAKQFRNLANLERTGVFFIVPLDRAEEGKTTRALLLNELKRIHLLDWINSKALGQNGQIKECESTHCVGYTLEAELGIPRNGRAEPDYKGWEIKAGLVSKLAALPTAKPITLMTPEPTGGFYRSSGVEAFVRKFGYVDKKGRPDRMNFGGIFAVGKMNSATGLTLQLDGFDRNLGEITNINGRLYLENKAGDVAAEWSFAALMTLWTRKHAQAAYVPALTRKVPSLQYKYGAIVRFAEGTDFPKFLTALASGKVYYDPGIKLEGASTSKPKTKRRSQFRISSRELSILYRQLTSLDVCK